MMIKYMYKDTILYDTVLNFNSHNRKEQFMNIDIHSLHIEWTDAYKTKKRITNGVVINDRNMNRYTYIVRSLFPWSNDFSGFLHVIDRYMSKYGNKKNTITNTTNTKGFIRHFVFGKRCFVRVKLESKTYWYVVRTDDPRYSKYSKHDLALLSKVLDMINTQ